MQPPEIKRTFQKFERNLNRGLRQDKWRLFQALQEFANIRPELKGWNQFRKRWPNFFPAEVWDIAKAESSTRTIRHYPYWLGQIWIGGETEPHLKILLGIETAPDSGTPEDASVADVESIPAQFVLDWDEGSFRYHGVCDFQRALYLLFRESWRARICEQCDAKFIARRAAQKYCSTDCSEAMQRQLKQRWWKKHGELWRSNRKESARQPRGARNGNTKAR